MSNETELIGLIDDLVVNPSRFPELVDQLTEEESFDRISRSDVGRHLRSATRLFDEDRNDTDEQADELATLLQQEQQPAFIVTSNAHIVTTNDLALEMYKAGPGEDLISLLNVEFQRDEVVRALRNCALMKDRATVEDRILRLSSDESGLFMLLALEPRVSREGADVLIVRCASMSWSAELRSMIVTLFDLTDAESEVLESFMLGHGPAGIARMRHTHITTVRAQIRSIYQKTGSQSQTDLMQLVFGLVRLQSASQSPTPDKSPKSAVEATIPECSPDLVDSRQKWLSLGPPAGRAMLALHDELQGEAFLYPLMSHGGARDVHFLVPFRSGYGGQPTAQDGDAHLAEHVALCRSLLERFSNGSPCDVVCHGNGFFHALTLASAIPDRIGQITAISPTLPVIDNQHRSRMPKYNRFLSQAGMSSSNLLAFSLRAGFSLYRRIGLRRFASMVYALDHDQSLLERTDVIDWLEQGSRLVGFNHEALFLDESVMRSDWLSMLANIDCRVVLVLGEHDKSRHERAKALTSVIDNMNLSIVEGTGQLLAFDKPEAVVSLWQ